MFGSYIVHLLVHFLSVPFDFQLSHSSHASLSIFPSPHVSFLHCFTSFLQFSHVSAGSIFQFQHVALHFHTSFSQFSHVSAASIFQFQQYAVHSHTSAGHVLHVSHSSIFQFQHCPQTPASSGQVSQFSHFSNFQFQQHTPASIGQFKQFSHSSIFQFQHFEILQQLSILKSIHPLIIFHGTSGHWSILSGIQSWSLSLFLRETVFWLFSPESEYHNIWRELLSHTSQIQLLFRSDWSEFSWNGQLSNEQTQNSFLNIS